MSYNASHSYSLAERRAFSSWINQHLSTDPDCKEHIPIDVDTEKLFNSLEDGIVLCKAINCAKPSKCCLKLPQDTTRHCIHCFKVAPELEIIKYV